MTLEGVVKNGTPVHHYVIGKERFREGRWKFRVDRAGWMMFGVLDASKADSSSGKGESYSWPGNYAITMNNTYSTGQISSASVPLQAGDLMTMEVKAAMLSVCNLRSGEVARVFVPDREHRLHLGLSGYTQVAWQR